MGYRAVADALVAFHLGFILFVMLGALLAFRWPRVVWLHLPCAIWGAWVELAGWVCPLTPLEVELRRKAGLEGYSGGFIENYVTPVVYPEALTRAGQLVLGIAVLVLNAFLYWRLWRRRPTFRE